MAGCKAVFGLMGVSLIAFSLVSCDQQATDPIEIPALAGPLAQTPSSVDANTPEPNGSELPTPDSTPSQPAALSPTDLLQQEIEMMDQFNVPSIELEPLAGFAVPPRGRLYVKTTGTGTSNSSEFDFNCEPGSVLAGINGRVGQRLDQLQALCVAVDDSGAWVGSPAAVGAPTGGSGGVAFSQICNTGFAVVGYSSDLATENPVYISLHCRKLDNATSSNGTTNELPGAGVLNGPATTDWCAEKAVATGLFGNASQAIDRVGLNCNENPSHAGRWSNVIDWPLISIHAVLTPEGKVLTYGATGDLNDMRFNYDVWDPELGVSSTSHTALQTTLGVASFCSAAMVMPDNGDILMPGGDARPDGVVNRGVTDAVIFDNDSTSISRAANMSFARWYPTATALPNGEILVNGGIDLAGNAILTPEIYSPETDQWRSLFGVSMTDYSYFYPRQWIAPDGRIFGSANNRMYYIDVAGNGSLTEAGVLPAYAYGNTSSSAMFEPGKIFLVGGAVMNGFGASVVDLTSGNPVVTQIDSVSQSRRTWSNSVLMADGKVLVLGGSYLNNDAVTASLGAERWDPTTEQWSQMSKSELPRLYHSTALLLKDGRVLLGGGGSPGPVTNRNAEIFSPPYLYNDSGSLATRPVIEYAPTQASHGQQIAVRTDNNQGISRVTMVKASSVTHSFNMDQRFIEIPFTATADALTLTLPATANIATPGYYLLFVFDENGTPSEAQIVSMCSVPAPSPPAPPTPPEPETFADSLLLDGGFEAGKTHWTDCADASLTSPSSNSVEGNQSMQVSSGGCLYQVVPVNENSTYTLECQSRGSDFDYSSVSMQMLDSNFIELASTHQPFSSNEFELTTQALVAPVDAIYASVDLYSEGAALYDSCILRADGATTPTPPPVPVTPVADNLLQNGGFENGKTQWVDCSLPALTEASADALSGTGALAVSGSGCLFQEFAVDPGATYRLHCSAKSENLQYTSMSLQLTDTSYVELAAEVATVGPDQYQSYSRDLLAPANSAFGAVTLYSEDVGHFDDCFVEQI